MANVTQPFFLTVCLSIMGVGYVFFFEKDPNDLDNLKKRKKSTAVFPDENDSRTESGREAS